MKPGKSSTETGSAVPHISDTFSPLISLPELQDTGFNYSNLRLFLETCAQNNYTFPQASPGLFALGS